jgi:hypothetical protein
MWFTEGDATTHDRGQLRMVDVLQSALAAPKHHRRDVQVQVVEESRADDQLDRVCCATCV